MPKNRDAAYYLRRLENEHPALAADVRAKKLSVRAASAKAGLIRLPSRLDALKREWRRASEREQLEFRKWLEGRSSGAFKTRSIADADGRLHHPVRAFIRDWLRRNKSKAGRIMKEMGFAGFDWTLSSAIERGTTLRAEVIPKLAEWLAKQGFAPPSTR